jgi:hypothetical protein
VYADGLQLLADGIGDRRFAAVGEHDRRPVGGVQGKELQTRFDFRNLRKQRADVLGPDGFDIRDLPIAEQR